MKSQRYPNHFHHRHSPEAIRARLSAGGRISYLRDLVYGAIDGTVTTFAVVSGVVGAELPVKTILILGMANLLADGFSMAASNYLGTQTENEERALLEEFERAQIDLNPAGETEEVREILRAKGFQGKLLDDAVAVTVADRAQWVETMLAGEYGIAHAPRPALRAALATFAAFVLCGSVPLLPYVFRMPHAFQWSWASTGLAFFAVGSLKSLWSVESWPVSGAKTLALGSIAAALSYFIGGVLKGIIT